MNLDVQVAELRSSLQAHLTSCTSKHEETNCKLDKLDNRMWMVMVGVLLAVLSSLLNLIFRH